MTLIFKILKVEILNREFNEKEGEEEEVGAAEEESGNTCH